MKPYPIFLVGLSNRHCIVIGGGREGEYKVKGLLDCDAIVTVISPALTPQLQVWADEGLFTWLNRPYQRGDLRGAFMVIAERAEPETNAEIWAEAESEGALVNVMDDVPHCTFVAGSVVRQGPLVISTSTSGATPALSVRLRQRFQREFGPEYGEFLTLMKALREPMSAHYPRFGDRRKKWYALVDSDILDHLRNGSRTKALERIVEIVGEEAAKKVLDPGD